MSKLISSQISAGSVVIARAGWTGYVTEIETVENDFLENATGKIVKNTTEVLTGVSTSREKVEFSFRCPMYRVGREFKQIGLYQIDEEGEIILSEVISKLPNDTCAFQRKISLDGSLVRCEKLDETVLNKINELVDAVNKLNGVHDNEC